MISGSLLHDHADKYNQLPDELKEQKHTDNQRHELQPVDIRSLDEYRTKVRDEHSEMTKTMKDPSIVHLETELEENAGNEQQLRRELSMVAQDNDAKHGDVNIRDRWLTKRTTISSFRMRTSKKTRNCMNRSKHTSHLQRKFWIRGSRKHWVVWLRTHTAKYMRYISNLQSNFDFPEEKLADFSR